MPNIKLRRSLQFGLGSIGLASVLSVFGYLSYSWHSSQFTKRHEALFNTLMPMETDRMASWAAERRADVSHYVFSPAAREVLEGLALRNPSPATRGRAAAWFAGALRAHPEYVRVDVLGVEGHRVWSTDARAVPEARAAPPSAPPDGELALSELALDDGRPLLTGLARVGPLIVSIPVDVGLNLFPSLGDRAPLRAGGFDLYLARRKDGTVEVLDHDPDSRGNTKSYRLPEDSAVARALDSGTLALGEDHFGKTIVALRAPTPWQGWSIIGTREVGAARSESRRLALVFGTLGGLAIAGSFLLASRLMRSAEDEGESAKERLKLLTRLNEALRVCATACRLAGSRKELAQEICRALSEGGGFQFTTVWEPAPDDRLRPLACAGLRPGTSLPENVSTTPTSEEEQSALARAYNSKATVVVEDLATDGRTPKFRSFGLAQGVRSVMAVPLSGVCAGTVLVVTSPQPGFFEGDARALVDSIAADFTAACAAFAAAEHRLRIDSELSKNRRLLEHIAATLPIGLFIVETKRNLTVFSTPAVPAIFEVPEESLFTEGPAAVLAKLHPDDSGAFGEYTAAFPTLTDGEILELPCRIRLAASRWKHLRLRFVVFERNPDGSPALLLGTVEDVSPAAEAREALEQSWKDYRRVLQAVECAAESIVITDERGVIQYVNPACSRVTGFTREEMVGEHTRRLKSGVHPKEFYQNLWRTISSGRVWSGRLVNKAKGGSFFEEDASIAPVMDEDGQITNFVAVKKDVTKEVSLESQLLQSQKLEAVGRLAGGIAHDFNNILTAILGYTQLSIQALPEGSPLREDLAEVEKGARRAADLTRQLLIFSRKQVIKPLVLEPSQVALGLQKMLRRIVGENFHLRFVSDAAGVRILADPGQLEQVLMNFVVNARDAMPKGGDIEVAVRETALAVAAPGVDGPIPVGSYAVLSVRDTGHGIPPDVLPRIFEPFYTTKPAGEGTGLGLSTVYGIVKQGGAYLRVESAPGEGTVMSVFWPAASPALAAERTSAVQAPLGGSEDILLVEDEPAVLALTERILKKAGYRVTSFSETASALAWARTAGARFHLLLTDVILPGGAGGKDLAESLRALRPGLRVLFTSGYSGDSLSKQGVLDAQTRLLPKPFSEETLLSAVRAALA